jgi:hypothetical protein
MMVCELTENKGRTGTTTLGRKYLQQKKETLISYLLENETIFFENCRMTNEEFTTPVDMLGPYLSRDNTSR